MCRSIKPKRRSLDYYATDKLINSAWLIVGHELSEAHVRRALLTVGSWARPKATFSTLLYREIAWNLRICRQAATSMVRLD
jgi:hypothetical protein